VDLASEVVAKLPERRLGDRLVAHDLAAFEKGDALRCDVAEVAAGNGRSVIFLINLRSTPVRKRRNVVAETEGPLGEEALRESRRTAACSGQIVDGKLEEEGASAKAERQQKL
jgi:hypothetical protein